MAYKQKIKPLKEKKTYYVINKEGEYSTEAGKYALSEVKPPTLNKGSQVLWTGYFQNHEIAKKIKRKLEK